MPAAVSCLRAEVKIGSLGPGLCSGPGDGRPTRVPIGNSGAAMGFGSLAEATDYAFMGFSKGTN